MKLRSQNVKLRQKLKELNQALDVALEKAQKNLTSKKQVIEHVEKVIMNTQVHYINMLNVIVRHHNVTRNL